MTTVLKLGGAVCDDDATLDALAAAWRARPAGEPWIVVHGAGPQLDAALAALGPTMRIQGLRVTPAEALPVIQKALDAVGARLTAALASRGVDVHHVPSGAKALHATPLAIDGIGRVGTPSSVSVSKLLQGGLVITGPLGWDEQGALNVNADDAACAVAKATVARCLLLATDVPHVRAADGSRLHVVATHDVDRLIADQTAQGGMVPKLRAAADAIACGVTEVIVGGVSAAWDGSGTRIHGAVAA